MYIKTHKAKKVKAKAVWADGWGTGQKGKAELKEV